MTREDQKSARERIHNEEYRLIRCVQTRCCEKSLSKLMMLNHSRIRKLAGKLQKKAKLPDGLLSESELINEGNFGLTKAVQKFDTSTGFRFWTYGRYQVGGMISDAIRRVSAGAIYPTEGSILDGISDHLVTPTAEGDLLLTLDVLSTCSRVNTIEEYYAIQSDPRRYDHRGRGIWDPRLFRDTRSEEILPLIQDDYDLEDTVIRTVEAEMLTELLPQVLSEVEALVLTKRYGLGNEDTHTLAEVGGFLGLSGERVRQIQRGAEEKLRGYDSLSSRYSKKSQDHVEKLAQVA